MAKESYLKEFNSSKNGALHDQSWVNKEMKKFVDNIYNINPFYCTNCHERWPSTVNCCVQCRKDKILFSDVIIS